LKTWFQETVMKHRVTLSLLFSGVLLSVSFLAAHTALQTPSQSASKVLWTRDKATSITHLAQAKAQPKSKESKPDGTTRQTAKPWTGSPLGPGQAFEAPNRAKVLRIQTVMDDLGIIAGSKVADIGAGGGWFTMLAARRVGAKGVVYAEDILPQYTRYIAQRARREGLRNVRTIQGTTTDPKLPRNTMDAVLILNAYHEFEQPLSVLRKIYVAMKPGARLAFIERDDEELRQQAREAYAQTGKIKRRVDESPDDNPLTDDHRLAREIVEREATSIGFRLLKSYDLGADNYVVIVEKVK
jgi:SAM-dependent methyltransferase